MASRIASVRGFASAMDLRRAMWRRAGRWSWACQEDLRARLTALPAGVLSAAEAS